MADKVSITICGDGGCGMSTPRPARNVIANIRDRQIVNNTATGAITMDIRLRPNDRRFIFSHPNR